MGRISVLTLRSNDDDSSDTVWYFANEQDCIAAFSKLVDQAKEFPVLIALEKESLTSSIYLVLTPTTPISYHQVGQIIMEHIFATDIADIDDNTFENCFSNSL